MVKNSIAALRRITVVVTEHSAQPFAPLDRAVGAANPRPWRNDVVANALMISFVLDSDLAVGPTSR
jgi:hypothetical protein